MRQMVFLITRPTFLILDLIGILIFGFAFLVVRSIWATVFLTAGSTFLTVGITLPVALYYQNKFSNESFQLLKACDEAGIKAVFRSRQADNHNLRAALEEAARTMSGELFLLGICFRTLFDPNIPHTDHMLARLNNPQTKIRVILLDPNSNAALRRAKIEIGNATIADINTTVNTGLISTIHTRMTDLLSRSEGFKSQITSYRSNRGVEEEENLLEKIVGSINLYIHTYSEVDPIMFIMGFDHVLFTEQYHFGRVEGVVPFGGCIGKYVPVIQYESGSLGYQFFKQHFEHMWKEYSRDITHSVVKIAINNFPF